MFWKNKYVRFFRAAGLRELLKIGLINMTRY